MFDIDQSKSTQLVIMGGDAFFGFDNSPKMCESSIFSLMERAYYRGIKSFEFSIQDEVISAVKKMKNKHPDIILFANISWRCGIKLGNIDLIDLKDEIINVVSDYLSEAEIIRLNEITSIAKNNWFTSKSKNRINYNEIEKISLDVDQFNSKIEKVKGLVDNCIVGSDFADWLVLLERKDILIHMCDIIVKNNMRPYAIIHWTSITLPKLSDLPFMGFFCMMNSNELILSEEDIIKVLSCINKPIYGFRILRGNTDRECDILQAFNNVFALPNIKGILIGMKTYEEIDETTIILQSIRKL